MKTKRISTVLICLSIAAIGLLRVERSQSNEPASEDRVLEHELRYVCIGSLAFELGGIRKAAPLEEFKLTLSDAEARRHCLPPNLPMRERPVVSVTAPSRGYGAVVERNPRAPTDALAFLRTEMQAVGWRETEASKQLGDIEKERKVIAYKRDNAWIFTTAVPVPNGAGSLLLTAGEWRAADWRR